MQVDPLKEECPTCGRGPDLTWTRFRELLDQERADVEDEVEFEAALTGDILRNRLARAVYDSLAPGSRR